MKTTENELTCAHNCLTCGYSFSEKGKDGDILHCMKKDGEVVKEGDCCKDCR